METVDRIIHWTLVVLVGIALGSGVVALAVGEVNIAEVEGKYREPTREEQLDNLRAQAMRHAMHALYLADQAGRFEERLRCEQIYDVEISSESK